MYTITAFRKLRRFIAPQYIRDTWQSQFRLDFFEILPGGVDETIVALAVLVVYVVGTGTLILTKIPQILR